MTYRTAFAIVASLIIGATLLAPQLPQPSVAESAAQHPRAGYSCDWAAAPADHGSAAFADTPLPRRCHWA
jgi:hypothetical protein